LRSFDVKGHLNADLHVTKSQAEGLVNGIDNAISQIAANEIDKVRDCMKPVRERLIDILFPPQTAPLPPPIERASPNEQVFGIAKDTTLRATPEPYGTPVAFLQAGTTTVSTTTGSQDGPEWVHVLTADGKYGYVRKSDLVPQR
jgi:hypothetical protein